MAATDSRPSRDAPITPSRDAPITPTRWRGLWRQLAGLLGSLLATGGARAVDLPEDRADLMVHVYDGGGVRATGPALLVRKKLLDRVSLTGSYYVDMVSNASIDVVTTASPYKENRSEYSLGGDYVYRDAQISLSSTYSSEPDYKARTTNLDVTQDVFGGMTSLSLGFTRGNDIVGKHNTALFNDRATHWKYRLGLTQILTPRLIASGNFEIMSDDGYLGSPYRAAQAFGTLVPERNPRTRSSRAVKFRVIGDIGSGTALRAEYRYFWDTWDIRAHTTELGASHTFGDAWLVDGFVRYYQQSKALFYADNATADTLYLSRNRQLSTFNSIGLGAKAAYTFAQSPGRYEVKGNLSYEFMRYRFKDFTDIRDGSLYRYDANVLQLFVSATF